MNKNRSRWVQTRKHWNLNRMQASRRHPRNLLDVTCAFEIPLVWLDWEPCKNLMKVCHFFFLNFECGAKFHRINKRLGFPTPWPWNPQISLEETLILIASLELPKSSISCNPLGCSVLRFHSVRSHIHFQNTSFSFSLEPVSLACCWWWWWFKSLSCVH